MKYVDSTIDRGYILGVTKHGPGIEKRIANVAVKLYPSLKEELERIAAVEVTLSQVTLFLIERGLAAYKRDSVLREPGGIALAMLKDSRTYV